MPIARLTLLLPVGDNYCPLTAVEVSAVLAEHKAPLPDASGRGAILCLGLQRRYIRWTPR